MRSPASSSQPDETPAREKDGGLLFIAVRVDAPSLEEAGQLTDELGAFLREAPRGLDFQSLRGDSDSPDTPWLLIALGRVVFLPGLISNLALWSRRRGVSLTFADVCVSGMRSAPWWDPGQVTPLESARQAEPPAPAVGELLSRVQSLNQKLVVLGQTAMTPELPPLMESAPAVLLADEDVAQFPLSGGQRQALVSMLEAQERAVQLYEKVCEERTRLVEQLKLKDQEIERLVQESHAQVRKLLAEADGLKAQGNLEGALEIYQDILPLSELLAEEESNRPESRRELAALYWTIGTLKTPSNSKAARRRYLARALQLTVKLEAEDPRPARGLMSSRKIRKALQNLPPRGGSCAAASLS